MYPEVYDCSKGEDLSKQVERHISTVLKEAAGNVPVYVFVSPRYCGENGDRSNFIPDKEFLRQANAALKACWIDANGVQHRIKGIILWDTYGYTESSAWLELDQKHQRHFELLQALVLAWKKSMAGTVVVVEPESSVPCKYGLAEPRNSAATLDVKTTKEQEALQNEKRVDGDRVKNERVPSGRVTD
ncbi:MAG TPA: hypothetical protein EYO40_08845 [Phycisphaerales bacterium]|nr:hypothetical protein [Phycisphaerales bacterium]